MSLDLTSDPTLSGALCIPASALTHAGFRAWAVSGDYPRAGQFSYVNERILIDMSPEELENHNRLKMEICRVLGNLVHARRDGYLYGDRTLLTHEPTGLSTEPDAVYVSRRRFKSGQVVAVPRPEHPGEFVELTGTPDWVLEVVSRSSIHKDHVLLRGAYHAAGVPEFWLVNALEDAISFRIMQRRSDDYAEAPAKDGWTRSKIFKSRFRIRRRRDSLGFWRYTLESKEA